MIISGMVSGSTAMCVPNLGIQSVKNIFEGQVGADGMYLLAVLPMAIALFSTRRLPSLYFGLLVNVFGRYFGKKNHFVQV